MEHEHSRADRRRRRDHAVELPRRDPVVEADPGAHLREHGRPQAGGDTPALAERFVELLAEAGSRAASSTSSTATARTRRRTARSPSRRPVITFTGSRETGIRVAKAAAERLKHLHVELGGKNAIIVLDDADLDLAVDGIVWSAFGTSGQRCTAASRVIVQRGAYDELQKRLVDARRDDAARPGLGGRHRHRPGDQPRRARQDPLLHRDRQGRGRHAAHRRRARDRRRPRQGLLLPPDRLRRRRAGMRIANEEIFGPTTALIPVGDFDEAIRVANGVGYGLSSSIFTRDVNKAFRAMRDLEAGHHVRQRRHDRRRGAPAVRRHEGHRQRPPRGGPGRARRVHRVEVDLRRLLRPAPARPDRHRE